MSLVGPRPCLPYETELLRAAPLRAVPRARGHHRPLAGDGAGASRRSPRRSTSTSPTSAAGRSGSTSSSSRARRSQVFRAARRGMTARFAIAVVGLGYWGPNLVRNLVELAGRRARVRLRPATPRRSSTIGAPLPDVRSDDATSRSVLADPTIEAVAIATPVGTHYRARARGARGRQARVRREAARGVARRGERARAGRRRRARARADARAHVPLQPAGAARSAI